MDDHSSRHFTAIRDAHFPPERNYLSAHITLFHQLPAVELERLCQDARECASEYVPMTVNVTGLRFLGRGVAYNVESAKLSGLRKRLAERWEHLLTRQDRERFMPHITVQNKVSADEARRLESELSTSFHRREITGLGLDFWFYRGGPWELAAFVAF